MLYSVQYLRGIASLLVLISHTNHKIWQVSGHENTWFTIGSGGVDLFFIISGFIMCYTLERRRELTPFGFLGARVKRIMPLYWTLSLVALAIYLVKPDVVNSSGGTTSILHSFTLIPVGEKLLIQNGWTLSYEFIFYLLFACGIALGISRAMTTTALLLVFLVLVGMVVTTDNPTFDFVANEILLEFLMGMLAYSYLRRYSDMKWLNILLLLAGIFALAYVNGHDTRLDRVVSLGLPFMAIFIGLVSFERQFKRHCDNLVSRLFKLLGDASYSLYLAHPFALAATALAIRKAGLQEHLSLGFSLLFGLSLAAGYLCYRLLELPLASLMNAWFRKRMGRALPTRAGGHNTERT